MPPADAVINWYTVHLLLPLWTHHITTQHVTALVRPPAGQSCLMRGGVAVLKVTHSLQPWELPLECPMGRYNRKPWVKRFWWSPQALISHTRGQSWFFLTISLHPLCQLRGAPCSVHIWSQVEFAVGWDHRCFWETFQICTKSFVSADAHVQTQFTHPLIFFFPSTPLKWKMSIEKEAQNIWRRQSYPSPPGVTLDMEKGHCCQCFLSFTRPAFFGVWWYGQWYWQKINLGAYLKTQAPLLGEILPASIVFIKSHTT